jgi:hypothetical protein
VNVRTMIGLDVLFRIGGDDRSPDLRPAKIIIPWSESCANISIFTGDQPIDALSFTDVELARGLARRTSVCRGDGVGEWRMMPAIPTVG